MAATPEKLLEAFLETRTSAESFDTAELMAFIRANLPARPDDETARKRQNLQRLPPPIFRIGTAMTRRPGSA